MRVECPSCGQRIEMTGRQANCPNCGQLVEAAFQPPLTPRAAPQQTERLEELEEVAGPPGQAGRYIPPPPEREFPAWLPATALILALFIGLFAVLYLGSLKLASYVPPPPPPAPPVVAPAPPPPPPPPVAQGSKVFSFN